VVSARRGHDERLRLSRPTGRVRRVSAPAIRRKAEVPGPACSVGRTIGGVTIGAPTGETTGSGVGVIETTGAWSS